MTTLTRIPRSVKIQTLPYMGPKKRPAPAYRKYAVIVDDMGVMPKVGPSYANLDAAMRKAATLSVQFGTAAVIDQSQSVGQRMISLFRKGKNFLEN